MPYDQEVLTRSINKVDLKVLPVTTNTLTTHTSSNLVYHVFTFCRSFDAVKHPDELLLLLLLMLLRPTIAVVKNCAKCQPQEPIVWWWRSTRPDLPMVVVVSDFHAEMQLREVESMSPSPWLLERTMMEPAKKFVLEKKRTTTMMRKRQQGDAVRDKRCRFGHEARQYRDTDLARASPGALKARGYGSQEKEQQQRTDQREKRM